MMKALRINKDASGAFSLNAVSLPIPKSKPGSALVKIHAAGINNSDTSNAKGYFPNTTFPRIPGRDFAGVVEDPSSSLNGKRVFGTSGHILSYTEDGTHAEYCLVSEKGLTEIPKRLSFVQAASIGVPWTTALLTLKRAHTQSKDVVVILGATGAVGDATTQLARSIGCKTITASRGDTTDINLTSDPTLESVKKLTDGRGADVIINTVGDPQLMSNALKALGFRGRLSYIASNPPDSELTFSLKTVYRQEQTIVGTNSLAYEPEETAALLAEIAPGFDDGRYKMKGDDEFTQVKLGEEVVDVYNNFRAAKKRFVVVP
ncbi:GroES-like protein [Xylona heveae TC161]|uniref:GroES-like protein n=1 Tax=Xylona heveae (strain CBS 132557 / TC161) TaxID=1328760 RepID=A0A165FL87_XYLHT|nr:GroES-like protein [Xylona heveae TC161]KZF21108.1 GroES-like protein [Xylona heveae TC161]